MIKKLYLCIWDMYVKKNVMSLYLKYLKNNHLIGGTKLIIYDRRRVYRNQG